MIDKLLQTLKKVPPYVKDTPIDRNQEFYEFASEPLYQEFNLGEEAYKFIALELWKLLEDIEIAERKTVEDTTALKSLVQELVSKRHVYMSQKEVDVLVKEKNTNTSI